jgi:transposase
VDSYRDPITKKVRMHTVKSLGYLDVLSKEYPDPIAHFTEVAAQMKLEAASEQVEKSIRIDSSQRLTAGDTYCKLLGYAPLAVLYRLLDLERFLRNHARKLNAEYDLNSIVRLLVYSRILSPCSKKKTFEEKGQYFDKSDFTLDDVYRSLTFLATLKDALIRHVHSKIEAEQPRDLSRVYYDVTNYYFEIDEQDALRRKGVSKEHRPDPIVQMGLLMDGNGVPITYSLFPGNTNDCETMIPVMKRLHNDFGLGRIVVVADKGLNTSDNIVFNLLHQDGYIYSQTVRGANQELQAYVLSEKGYTAKGEGFKIKSRIYPREVWVTDVHGKRKKESIDEKQVVFYNADYDARAKKQRESTLKKARDMAAHPGRYNQATSFGAERYVKQLTFDLQTGEVVDTGMKPVFDEERQKKEEQFDGYYAIVTSELDKTDEQIIDLYRGLWKIEESFKVTKSDFKTRPVYVSREDHIQAHFLICFLALVIARLLERRLENRFTIGRIVQSLSQATCTLVGGNEYVFHHADEVTQAVREKMGVDLEKRYRTPGEIKKVLAHGNQAP